MPAWQQLCTQEYKQNYDDMYNCSCTTQAKNNDQSVRNNKATNLRQKRTQSLFHGQLTMSRIFPLTVLYTLCGHYTCPPPDTKGQNGAALTSWQWSRQPRDMPLHSSRPSAIYTLIQLIQSSEHKKNYRSPIKLF